jgi:putative serine protease PepD
MTETPQTSGSDTPDFYRPTADGSDAPAPRQAASTRSAASKGAAFGLGSAADSEGDESSAPRSGSRTLVLPVVVALAIGALLGGGAGAGVALVVSNNNANNSGSASVHAGVVVNDPSHVNSVTGVVSQASPSVVTISVTGSSGAGTGSGVILTSDGYVLTNNHVATLDGATAKPTITVQDNVGHIYQATIVGTDPTVDMAVLKLTNASGLTPIEWADSSKLNVGDATIAMGAPLGLAGTVTTGIVSALNRSIQVASSAAPSTAPQDNQGQQGSPFNFDFGNGSQSQGSAQATISIPVIQTDAAINPGNSGGALLDEGGRLIGINVAIASAGSSSGQSGSIGVGFALPSNLAKRVSDEIIKSGRATHGMLGAQVTDASSAKGSTQVGATLAKVNSGSAADKGGLKAGDIVIEFNGTPITGASDLTAAVRTEAAGAKAEVIYLRGGSKHTATVTLDTLPAK